MAEQRLQLDLTALEAESIIDEDGRPALVLRWPNTTGDVVIEMSGGAHLRDAVAGARRITDAIWRYILAVEAKRLEQPDAPPPIPWGVGLSGPGASFMGGNGRQIDNAEDA